MLFIEYPPCGTCKKAKKYLKGQGAAFDCRHIAEEPPTREELETWREKSGLPLKRFFNTSGKEYRELALKEKLPAMSEAEQFELLSSDGMLVKRPILVKGDTVLVGFKEKEWEEALR